MKRLVDISGLLVLGGLLVFGCREDTVENNLGQFRHPGKAALVCWHNERGPLPLASCDNAVRTDAEIHALVTQSEYGEVAVVNLANYLIVDQSEGIPFNSFVPVGGQPLDIVVAPEGDMAYTVNHETRDISVIDVSAAMSGTHAYPAQSIFLGESGYRMVVRTHLAQDASYRFALVTMPESGTVAVVNLEAYTFDTGTGDEQIAPIGVMATLRLDGSTLASAISEDPRPGGIKPTTIVASERYASVYVGGSDDALSEEGHGSSVFEIHRDVLFNRAKTAYEARLVDDDTAPPPSVEAEGIVIRRMNIGEFTVVDMDVEPELERWLYIVERERGGVIVLDLVTGALVPVNEWNVLADDLYSLSFPGIARAVSMVRLDEIVPDGDIPGTLDFHGSYAAVSTTKGAVYVVDVNVDDHILSRVDDYTVYSHSLHSATGLYVENDDDQVEPLFPELDSLPRLFGDDREVSVVGTPFVAHEDDIFGDGCGDAPNGYRRREDEVASNVYFRCDRRYSTRETWQLTWEGRIGVSGLAAILPDTETDDTVTLLDEYKAFCSAGVLGPAGPNLWTHYTEDEDAGLFEAFRDYPGDIVEITSAPTPVDDNEDCSAFDPEKVHLQYRVVDLPSDDKMVIAPMTDTETRTFAPLPSRACFGQALTYVVRASNSWILKGSRTGDLIHGTRVNETCVPWTSSSDAYMGHRVFETHPYANYYMTFVFDPHASVTQEMRDTYDQLTFAFMTKNAFDPLSYSLGADVTDLLFSPTDHLLAVDRSGSRLLVFDMIDEFKLAAEPIR